MRTLQRGIAREWSVYPKFGSARRGPWFDSHRLTSSRPQGPAVGLGVNIKYRRDSGYGCLVCPLRLAATAALRVLLWQLRLGTTIVRQQVLPATG